MAIVIPSKNIYEIDNQKVVDNEVDNVEVNAKNASAIKKYSETVFHDTYSVDAEYDEEKAYDDIQGDVARTSAYPNGDKAVGVFNYVLYDSFKYIDKKVLIRKIENNQYIEQLLLKKDKEGQDRISVTIYGYEKKGSFVTSNWSADITYAGDEKYDITNVTKGYIAYSPPDNDPVPENFQIPLTTSSNTTYNTEAGILGKEAVVTIENGNIGTVSANEIKQNGIEYYELNLHILSGVRILSFSSESETLPSQYEAIESIPILGRDTYTIYEAEQIEISILGNTTVIDLQDETVKIGDGQHVYSFSGNELVQTSNKYSNNKIQGNYFKIIQDWRNGKETAVIRCMISDYYTDFEKTKGSVFVSNATPYSSGMSLISFGINNEIETAYNESIVIYIGNVAQTVTNINNTSVVGRTYYYTGVVELDTTQIATERSYEIEYMSREKAISPSNKELKTTFHIGDVCIPYVKGADGNDKPMSLYFDKTPKEFNVIGKGIIADGQIMQELTLQEITKKQNEENDVLISVDSEVTVLENTVSLQITLLYGELSVNDEIQYMGDSALINEIVGSGETKQFEIWTNKNGAIHSKLGQTIIVTKINSNNVLQ